MNFTSVVTLLSRSVTGQDSYGNDVYAAVATDVPAIIMPRTSGRATGAGSTEATKAAADVVTTGLTVILLPGTAVKAVDQFKVSGAVYDVDGDPADWTSPLTGTPAGVQVELVKVTG